MIGQEIVDDEISIRQTLNQIGDNVWEHNFVTGVTNFSDTFELILGYDNGEITDKAALWWKITHPDDLHLLKKNDIAYNEGRLTNHSLEYRVFHKNGSERWIHDRGVVTVWGDDKKPLIISGIHSDITARKILEKRIADSEQKFTDLTMNVPGVIYQWQGNYDGSYDFPFVSPKLNEYFQIEPSDMERFLSYVHPGDMENLRSSVDYSKTTGTSWNFEGRLLYPDGTLKWWRGDSIVTEKNDKGVLFNGIITDITERKKLQQLLEWEKEEAKKNMLRAVINAQEIERGIISYELHDNVNQLLASTKMMLELVGSDNVKSEGYLTRSIANIEKVIGEIRNISHGINPDILKFVGLCPAIRDLINTLNLSGKIEFSFDDSRWCSKMEIDREIELALFRMIQSQVSNILIHSKASSAEIELSNRHDQLGLLISDDGIGFDLNHTRKGLGLLNMHNRTALFNGTVSIATSPNNGCMLSISIPALTTKAKSNHY